MAIRTIQIDSSVTLPQLRKEFRKGLMTGGAVIRIRPGLSDTELEKLFSAVTAEPDKSEPGDTRVDGVAAIVMQELLREANLPSHLKSQIYSLGLTPDVRARQAEIESISSASLSAQNLRRLFLTSLGDGGENIEKRRRLAKSAGLPSDLVFLLARDPDASVRFHLKFISSVPERVYETSGSKDSQSF